LCSGETSDSPIPPPCPSNLPKAYSSRGADLGRSSSHPGLEPTGPLTVRRIPIDAQGYDSGGAYWGTGNPLYCLTGESDEETIESFYRAADDADAIAHAGKLYPGAEILPPPDADRLESFIDSYIETMLWAENDESDPETGGDPLDDNYGPDDISAEAMDEIRRDCIAFYHANRSLIESAHHPEYSAEEMAGHDFWLTRNGHGAGFWDRPEVYGQENADKLSDAADAFGSCHPYVGDDGLIYLV
jgi:hypothetical protein